MLDALHLSIGNGARYTNVFPLMHCGGVHDHWRQETDRKRVFILTRSAFLGQQRYATTVWSGDVIGTWMTFRRQIAAGLNFQMSGLPYWTTDIAGYGWPYERDTRDPDYQELYVRWFQYGVFCPILRTHGHRVNDTNELFSYGTQTPSLIALRQAALPAAALYLFAGLARDSRRLHDATRLADGLAGGPAGARHRRSVHVRTRLPGRSGHRAGSRRVARCTCPQAPAWYDFWTGKRLSGAETRRSRRAARADSAVRARRLDRPPRARGAERRGFSRILLEVRVYPGADGEFEWYSDAGDTYDYEKGLHRIVPLRWDDAARTLVLGEGAGQLSGNAEARSNSVWSSCARVTALASEPTAESDGEGVYEGRALRIAAR